MPIWVDADACPLPIKEILYRAAHRAHEAQLNHPDPDEDGDDYEEEEE